MKWLRKREPEPPPAPRIMTEVTSEGELMVSRDSGVTWEPYETIPEAGQDWPPVAVVTVSRGCVGHCRCSCHHRSLRY